MAGKKIVYYGPKDIRIEEMESRPQCPDGGMLVRVEAAAICGSDIKAYNVGNPKLLPGRTMGHEFVGQVVEPGGEFNVGDRITMATTIGCGTCYYCRKGRTNMCLTAKSIGFYYDGAMADYIAIPKEAVMNGNVVRVDKDIPAQVVALSEPMSCVINGLSRIPVKEMDCALVIGLGALGILHTIALSRAGVRNIACCDFPGIKKDLVKSLDFNTVTPDELEIGFKDLSDGLGFDLVVITAPSRQVQQEAPKYARKGGYVSYFASMPVSSDYINLSSRMLHYNELFYFGTSDSTAEHVKSAVKLLDSERDIVQKIITILPFSEFEEGMKGVVEARYAKVVLMPEI